MSGYIVLGRDATACCVAHRRRVRWISAPGWWIHDDDLPSTGHRGDPRGCSGMWDAPAPIVIVPVEEATR